MNNDQSPRAGDGTPAAALQPLPQTEFDALMDHIYEHGTMAEGITARARAMCEAYARAALAAAPAAAPAWQPIETAPKDGSMFLCWVSAERWSSEDGGGSGRSHDTSGVDFAWWRPPHPEGGDGYFVNCSGQMGDQQDITHWMPLPAAPEIPCAATGDQQ